MVAETSAGLQDFPVVCTKRETRVAHTHKHTHTHTPIEFAAQKQIQTQSRHKGDTKEIGVCMRPHVRHLSLALYALTYTYSHKIT